MWLNLLVDDCQCHNIAKLKKTSWYVDSAPHPPLVSTLQRDALCVVQ